MFQFKEGDTVLVGDGACGQDALSVAKEHAKTNFFVFEGVEIQDTLDRFKRIQTRSVALIGGRLKTVPSGRVFLIGDPPRARVGNAELLYEDPRLMANLLGTLDQAAAPLRQARLRTLAEECHQAGLTPTSIEVALKPGTIRYGALAGPAMSSARIKALEAHAGAVLQPGSCRVGFVVGSELVAPARPRPLLRHIHDMNHVEDQKVALLWSPARTEVFDANFIDQQIVENCGRQSIGEILLIGGEVIPTGMEKIRSTCESLGVSLYRSSIGD